MNGPSGAGRVEPPGPAGSVPVAAFVYTGGTTVARTSWIDIDSGRLIETRETGRYDMTTRAQGLPPGALPPGGVRMTSTVTMTLEPV